MEDGMKLYIVETISIFRHRYAIEAKESGHACDTVVMHEAEEMSQEHLDEIISSVRQIDEEEYLRIYKEDNASWSSSWEDSQRLRFIHKVKY